MSSLTLRFEPDPADDVGKLWMTVQTDRFTGTGFYWSYRDGMTRFAEKLAAYPLSEPAAEAWAEADNVILAVQIMPVGNLGDLVAQVEVADLYEVRQRLTATFATSYVEVAAFKQQLDALAEGRTDQALLTGS